MLESKCFDESKLKSLGVSELSIKELVSNPPSVAEWVVCDMELYDVEKKNIYDDMDREIYDIMKKNINNE